MSEIKKETFYIKIGRIINQESVSPTQIQDEKNKSRGNFLHKNLDFPNPGLGNFSYNIRSNNDNNESGNVKKNQGIKKK